mmetsp:Transcript_1263/g.1342  ORF Transcript_1263/g.1342 Transcript_1263/m.1342 type:complete len:140 (-) Transcript_1263:451-870(-)
MAMAWICHCVDSITCILCDIGWLIVPLWSHLTIYSQHSAAMPVKKTIIILNTMLFVIGIVTVVIFTVVDVVLHSGFDFFGAVDVWLLLLFLPDPCVPLPFEDRTCQPSHVFVRPQEQQLRWQWRLLLLPSTDCFLPHGQ